MGRNGRGSNATISTDEQILENTDPGGIHRHAKKTEHQSAGAVKSAEEQINPNLHVREASIEVEGKKATVEHKGHAVGGQTHFGDPSLYKRH